MPKPGKRRPRVASAWGAAVAAVAVLVWVTTNGSVHGDDRRAVLTICAAFLVVAAWLVERAVSARQPTRWPVVGTSGEGLRAGVPWLVAALVVLLVGRGL